MDEKLQYFWGSLKNSTFKGGSRKTNIEGGDSKKGSLGLFADLRGSLVRKGGGGVFEGG